MQIKTCRVCGKEKTLVEFKKVTKCRDGYGHKCKDCVLIYKRNYYKENKSLYQDYYKENKDKRLEYQKDYWEKNPELRSKIRNDYRVAKLSSTIKSLTEQDHLDIKEFYKICQWMTEMFEEPFHVDHIVPLQGENVCGLHVPWNLQIITAKENISKSNKFEN
jgi:hypothetical protein